MSIEGKWVNGGVITIDKSNKQVTAKDMGSRPNGTGVLLCENPDVVLINFPDDRPYTGTLINQNQIQWCGLGTLRDKNVWNR